MSQVLKYLNVSSVSIQLGIFVLCNTTTQWQVTVCIRHAILCIKTLQYKNVNAINKKNVSLNVFMKCKKKQMKGN